MSKAILWRVLPVALGIGALIGLLSVSTMVLQQPLEISVTPMDGERERVHHARMRQFSTPAIGGMLHFGKHCAACHGREAEGTDQGPSLIDRSFALDFRDSEVLHSELAQQIPAHRAIMRANQASGVLSFNEIEMMGKYLREARRSQAE